MQNSLLLQPPLGATVDPRVEFWVTLINVIVGLAWLGYAIVEWRRTGRTTFLLLVLGGAAMCIIEPFIDTVGACWFPQNAPAAFKFYGRPMPYWLIFSYLNYFGVGTAVIWRMMRAGMSRGKLWGLYAGMFIADVILEAVLLPFNSYLYYGSQPLVILHFPIWWAAINSCTPIMLAAAVTRYEAYFSHSWRQLAIIPLSLTITMAVNAAVGWPSWLVINTPVSGLITQIGGLTSIALSIWLTAFIVKEFAAAPAAAAPKLSNLANQIS